ncbi:MAG: dihydrolipoyl dehydrogenase [Chloroflexi bacterium RBG_13_56_8]|nr:MAG: dihydrolipoyl dehydrogenase [Chloroflexi bacterium RBG_13_56_8]
MTIKTDIAIIGAGPAGYIAALRASQLGAKVVCIEKRWLGGVCLNEGCIPTKALLRSAEVFSLVKKAPDYGVMVDDLILDWSKAQERKGQVVRQLVNGVAMLLERAGVQVLMGEAFFIRPDILTVRLPDGTETVTADKIIIATGSRTLQVPIPGLDGPGVIDHAGALDLEALPESICIIGGGAIGLEFASLFATFDVQVTLVEMLPRLAPTMDSAIGEGLAWSLGQRGVEVLTNTRVENITPTSAGSLVSMTAPGGERQLETQMVLSAIGRAPNTEGLGLEVLGLHPTRQGIQVDDRMRTAVPNVYAIGDVAADGPMLAHVGSHQGIVAVEDALGHPASMDYRAVPSCIFSLPEAASVGLSEEEARERGYEVRTGIFALANNGKALAMGDSEGFIKFVADTQYGEILGLHIVGPHASDLILEGTLAISLEATLDEIEHTIHPHPSLGEAIGEAALAVRKRALQVPRS